MKMMYKVLQPGSNDKHETVIYTEDEIISEYWDFWSERMAKKYGSDSPRITIQNCINDWCVMHWAEEVN